MQLLPLLRKFAVFSMVSLVCGSCDNSATRAQKAADALARCDSLASDPNDPGRFAAGVSDEQMAPGAAIEACQSASTLNPDNARAQFEFGRSLWLARRDKEAVLAFSEAADRRYGAAEKYMGDAFVQGRGLPSSEHQDAYSALSWYAKSEKDGYLEARKAADAVQDDQKAAVEENAKNNFDASLFQNPDYMRRLYEGDFANIQYPPLFFHYVRAVMNELGSDKILYVDQQCRPLVTMLGTTALGLANIASYLDMVASKSQEQETKAVLSLLGSAIAKDQGQRDAVTLINKYGCKGTITPTIVNNVVMKYSDVKNADSARAALAKLRAMLGPQASSQ